MTVELVETVKTLVDLGGTVILTVMLYLVWQRLNTVTDRLIEIVSELRLQYLEKQTAPYRPALPHEPAPPED